MGVINNVYIHQSVYNEINKFDNVNVRNFLNYELERLVNEISKKKELYYVCSNQSFDKVADNKYCQFVFYIDDNGITIRKEILYNKYELQMLSNILE